MFGTNKYRTQYIMRENKEISIFDVQNNDIVEEMTEGEVYNYLGKHNLNILITWKLKID